jgi:hypothetical protein
MQKEIKYSHDSRKKSPPRKKKNADKDKIIPFDSSHRNNHSPKTQTLIENCFS